ncbi:MAG: hypothetical protein A2151_03970 [Candidatus Muproteobacteria bacterium RBG_16_65_34]|uniref:Putative antitoxin VapB45-like DNA-binding HTH domain-containing protein n=1 Tax=Candidatus Muproteobacteria bacterium RBG_16_65_34 TaxID=1817760 RepID=A0A1F6TTA8_9PROT|nr:MAG: hypothetical protein A2151_03970 [Candidatus Muproteobacteria bacterium RBG_16_65_34]
MGQVLTSARPDPREVPTYTLAEAAYYLGIPVATLRSWVLGRQYPVAAGKRLFAPIIEIADKKNRRLSFINLVEAHVLSAIRREHEIRLPNVRRAIKYLRSKLRSRHPLADQHFETDGLDLFVQEYGRLINITRDGQLAMRNVLQSFLKRVKRDAQGSPVKLYLFVRGAVEEPFAVVVDPTVSFGRPVLEGTGIPTEILAQRYKAGDSYEQLVEDYGRPKEEIEEAIRYELLKAA